MSASWSFKFDKDGHSERLLSLIKWKFTSMYLIVSWKTGLDAMCKAIWLSQINFICLSSLECNSPISWFKHNSSHIAWAMARYSTFVLDLSHLTISCFSLFQDTKLLLMNTRYHEVESLSFEICKNQLLDCAICHATHLDLGLLWCTKWCTLQRPNNYHTTTEGIG